MVGMAAVKVRITPESPDTNLEEIKQQIQEKLIDAKNIQIEEDPIAFGLKALVLLIAWPEDKETDDIQNILQDIPGVSGCEIQDIRRAFG